MVVDLLQLIEDEDIRSIYGTSQEKSEAFHSQNQSIFKEKCVDGVEANFSKMNETIEQSLSLVTALAPVLGYDKAAALSQRAFQENKTIRDVVREEDLMSDADLDSLLDPTSMLHPTE